jgi:phage minor structural protein
MIRVYDSTETLFENNGIKVLNPLLAEITKIDNDDYYVELRDTLDNIDYYQKGMIIRISTPWGVQGFRCDNPIITNNRIECKAWHLSYDAKLYVIKDANSVDKNCNDALDHFNSATDRPTPFTTISDITKVLSTRKVRKTLFEVYGELADAEAYGGHWYRDNFTLGIKSSIGQDRGVVLAQNKNITDMQVTEEWDEVCTKILPYTTDGEKAILLDETYVELEEELYDITYSKVVEFTNELKLEDYETEEEFIEATKNWLKEQANSYLGQNKLPKINYSVSAKIDNVSDIGDVIYVKHPKCRVDIQTNVIGIVYDAIRQKYVSIEFGNFKKKIKNLREQITASVKKDTEEVIKEHKVLLEKELDEATSKINSVLGNSYVINDGNEIIIVDRLPKEEAIYCLKINSAGIGFSSTGIYGTYNSAWTIDGTLNMQNINVINFTASLIKGGTLKLGGVDNSSGTFELYDNRNELMVLMDRTGLTVHATNGDYVKLNADEGFVGYDKNGNRSYWADGNVFHMTNAEIENIAKFAGMIQLVPVSTSSSTGIGFVALSN